MKLSDIKVCLGCGHLEHIEIKGYGRKCCDEINYVNIMEYLNSKSINQAVEIIKALKKDEK